MKTVMRALLVGAVLISLAGCGAGRGSGLVVIPPAIEKAQPPEGKYKDVHAIVLYDIGFSHFDTMEIGHSKYPNYVFSNFAKVKLLTRAATEGNRYGNIFIRHIMELRDKGAYIIKPDGTRVELKKSDYVTNIMVKNVIPGATPPIHLYETVIIFPGLAPGDTIVYHYTQEAAPLTWTFTHRDAPVLYSKFMVSRPMRRIEVQPLIYDRHDLKPEHDEEKGLATGMAGRVGSRQAEFDIWTVEDVPPLKGELSMPPLGDLNSWIRVWHGDKRWDWETMGRTYFKWFDHYGRHRASAKALADKVIGGATDIREQAKAIHDWVKQNLNIVDFPRLSWVPRQFEIHTIDLDDVLKEKDATSEQAANMMYMMMIAAGIDASVVLTTDAGEPEVVKGFPDFYQFTRSLLALPDGTLIDTTHRQCPFGQIPYWFEGRKSLWLGKSTMVFKDLPVSKTTDNKNQLTIKGSLNPEGEASVEVRRIMTGHEAFDIRRKIASLNDEQREKEVREWVLYASEKAELGDLVFKNMDDLDKPLEMTLIYKVPGYADVLQDKMVAKLGAFVHLTGCPFLMSEERLNPLWFPYKNLEEMDIRIEMPTGYTLQALPKGFRTKQIEEGTAVGVQTSYGSPDGKSLHVIRKFSVNQTSLAVDGYKNLQKMIRRYLAQKDTLITMELPKLTD